MKYDFETLVPRKNVGASKWDMMYGIKPSLRDGVVPFSVADMEFKNAPEIIEGLKSYLDTAILGYTQPTDGYYEAVIDWCRRRHGYIPEKKHILTSPGVINAFVKGAGALAGKGDSIVFMTPAYPPFWNAGNANGLPVVECPLIDCGDTYEIDFELFESIVSRPDVKVFILCNPHNPVGRVWTREELTRMLDLCLEHGVYVISDEIHSDLIMPGVTHTSVAAMDEKYHPIIAVCCAPSKTFNIAGMQTSNVIVFDDGIRERFVNGGAHVGLTALGYEACRLAYAYGEDWLTELLTVIKDNYDTAVDFISSRIPKLKVYRLEGTYLMWVDMRGLGLSKEEIERINLEHDLFLDEGYIFGKEGTGFERINIACPKWVLTEALERFADAFGSI